MSKFIMILKSGSVTPVTSTYITNEEILFTVYDYNSSPTFNNDAIYAWDFGDNVLKPQTGTTALHTFIKTGTFIVTLTVTNTDTGSTVTTYTSSITIGGTNVLTAPVYTSPLVEMKFENSIADTSSNARATACTTPVYASGIDGYALNTSGTSGYATITSGIFLNGLSEFTLSFWMRNSADSGYGYLISKIDGSSNIELQVRTQTDYLGAKIKIGSTLYTAETYLDFGFNDIYWHQVALTYDGSEIHLYYDYHEIIGTTSPPTSATGTLTMSSTPIYIGRQAGGTTTFQGYIDNVKMYAAALSLNELYNGLEVWHADFCSRYSQYLYVQVPNAYRSYTLAVTLTGANTGYSNTLFSQTGSLTAEEKVLLNNYTLNADTYTLTVAILNGSTQVDSWIERWTKSYSGVPVVGIDCNNGYRVNGTLTFPVTTWITDSRYISAWITNGRANLLCGLGYSNSWGSTKLLSDWTSYLAAGVTAGVRSIGPDRWSPGWVDYPNTRNTNIGTMQTYVNSLKANAGMLAWSWMDEPNLGGDSSETPASTVRAWSRVCHDIDQNHPTHINFAGNSYTRYISNDSGTYAWDVTNRRKLGFLYNKYLFGKRTTVADNLSFDYYPIDWASPHTNVGTVARLAFAIDNIVAENYNLVPIFSFVETTDIEESPYSTLWYPTPAQVKMLCWLNVIHGASGISWFPYFATTPDQNWSTLSDFKTLADYFTSIIFSGTSSYTSSVSWTAATTAWSNSTAYVRGDEVLHSSVSYICIVANTNIEPGADDANAAYWKISRRVDTMIKDDGSNMYLFAVRMTEIDNVGASASLTVDGTLISAISGQLANAVAVSVGTDALSTTFLLSNSYSGTVTVYGESRTLIATSGVFTDTFDRNAVHVYVIPLAPVITTQPTDTTVYASAIATLTVVATGATSYQWYKDNIAIDYATSASYITPFLTSSYNGSIYKCRVTNSVGYVDSNSATLTVNTETFSSSNRPVHTALVVDSVTHYMCLPWNYELTENASRKYPILLYLHGATQDAYFRNLSYMGYENSDSYNLAYAIAFKNTYPCFSIIPQTNLVEPWTASIISDIIEYMISNYRVDTDRIYLHGFSMGSAGIDKVANYMDVTNARYSSAILNLTASGVYSEYYIPWNDNVKDKACTWSLVGTADDAARVTIIEEKYAAMKAYITGGTETEVNTTTGSYATTILNYAKNGLALANRTEFTGADHYITEWPFEDDSRYMNWTFNQHLKRRS
jgi:hypothetical protein